MSWGRPVNARGFFSFLSISGFWSTTWKITKCVSSLVLAAVPIAQTASEITKLGGIAKAAKLMVEARTIDDVKQIAPYLAGEVFGIQLIADSCFQGASR